MATHRNRGKNARNVSVKIWLSSAELEQLQNAAGDAPVSTWLRCLGLGQPPKPRSPKIRRERKCLQRHASISQPLAIAISRIGNNLNQIARAVNSKLREGKPMDVIVVVNELAHIRQLMRDGLEDAFSQMTKGGAVAGEDIQTR